MHHNTQPKLTGTVRYFNIRTDIAPRQLIVQIGDEIRWQNLNSEPVRLRLLEEGNPTRLECGKGFSQFGVAQDTVTIAPLQYASLCFGKPGTVRFNVAGRREPSGRHDADRQHPDRTTRHLHTKVLKDLNGDVSARSFPRPRQSAGNVDGWIAEQRRNHGGPHIA